MIPILIGMACSFIALLWLKKRKKSTKGKTSKRPKVSDKKVRLDIKTLEKYAKVLTSDKRYKHLLKGEKKDDKKKADKKVKFEPIIID